MDVASEEELHRRQLETQWGKELFVLVGLMVKERQSLMPLTGVSPHSPPSSVPFYLNRRVALLRQAAVEKQKTRHVAPLELPDALWYRFTQNNGMYREVHAGAQGFTFPQALAASHSPSKDASSPSPSPKRRVHRVPSL